LGAPAAELECGAAVEEDPAYYRRTERAVHRLRLAVRGLVEGVESGQLVRAEQRPEPQSARYSFGLGGRQPLRVRRQRRALVIQAPPVVAAAAPGRRVDRDAVPAEPPATPRGAPPGVAWQLRGRAAATGGVRVGLPG